jgi:hypothetical protein
MRSTRSSHRSRAASAALLLGLSACAAPEPVAAPNSLTERERSEGWVLLFDGETPRGWRGYRQETMPAGWRVEEGALTRVAEAGDIVTEGVYRSFVLDFEWQVAPGANSGVMFHVTEDHGAPWETGPEYQILDDAAHRDGLDPTTSAGSNYAMHAPESDATRPAGEWNQARIEVRGERVVHWLNGVRLLEYELGSPDWQERVERCKWKDMPDYGRRAEGRIALQDHGDRVAYRSLKIHVLD